MAEIHRRVILKPPDVSDSVASQLGERLSAAIETQRAIAVQSPHILQLLGGLQETDQAFFVEHEPASPKFVILRQASRLRSSSKPRHGPYSMPCVSPMPITEARPCPTGGFAPGSC